MQPVGSDFSRTCRQFDNLDKGTESGDLARAAKEGDTVTFMEFLRPAAGGGNYHNIRRMVSMGAAPAALLTQTLTRQQYLLWFHQENLLGFHQKMRWSIWHSLDSRKRPPDTSLGTR